MPSDAFHHLDDVARHLPFGVDDYDRASAAFGLWRETGREADKKVVDLWVYCYTQRYFLIRFLEERGEPSDVDRCISEAYKRVQGAYGQVEETDRFAAYVSVVCKRTLLNHRRRRRDVVEVTERTAVVQPPEAPAADLALVRHVLRVAIAAMPSALREVGRLRWVDGLEYDAIAEQTGIALATVRTYAARAAGRLRDDPGVRALQFDDLAPPDLPDP